MQHGTFFCDESKARYNEMFVLTFYTLLIEISIIEKSGRQSGD